jgi:hypothetical protein
MNIVFILALLLIILIVIVFFLKKERYQPQADPEECPICLMPTDNWEIVCSNYRQLFDQFVQNLVSSGVPRQNAEVVASYAVPQHRVCTSCARSLTKCPICRAPLPESEQVNSDSELNFDSDSELVELPEGGFGGFGMSNEERLAEITNMKNTIYFMIDRMRSNNPTQRINDMINVLTQALNMLNIAENLLSENPIGSSQLQSEAQTYMDYVLRNIIF